jgi:hypothetical protein
MVGIRNHREALHLKPVVADHLADPGVDERRLGADVRANQQNGISLRSR